MCNSMMFGSFLIFLLLATCAYGFGRLDMQLHAAQPHKKVNSQKDEMPADFKWQRQPSLSSPPPGSRNGLGGSTTQDHRHLTTSTTGRAAGKEEDGEVKKMMARTHRELAHRLTHQDYVGPSGHSPNHHRAIPCGPC